VGFPAQQSASLTIAMGFILTCALALVIFDLAAYRNDVLIRREPLCQTYRTSVPCFLISSTNFLASESDFNLMM
jgi:hypothetical protein